MAWVTLNDCLSTVAINKGGTGMTTNPSLAVDLSSTSTANIFQSDPRPGVINTLPITNGGTGATTRLDARRNLKFWAGTKTVTVSSKTSAVLFSKSQFTNITGMSSGAGHVILVSNGDANVQSAHATGASFKDPDWYVTFNTNVNGSYRVNYLIVLHDGNLN